MNIYSYCAAWLLWAMSIHLAYAQSPIPPQPLVEQIDSVEGGFLDTIEALFENTDLSGTTSGILMDRTLATVGIVGTISA